MENFPAGRRQQRLKSARIPARFFLASQKIFSPIHALCLLVQLLKLRRCFLILQCFESTAIYSTPCPPIMYNFGCAEPLIDYSTRRLPHQSTFTETAEGMPRRRVFQRGADNYPFQISVAESRFVKPLVKISKAGSHLLTDDCPINCNYQITLL